jgi:Family of unknown function (DUF6518)
MTPTKRVIWLLVLAPALGALMAWATDQGGDSRSTLSQLRNVIGSLSTPWVLIPFVAGTLCARRLTGALLGLATTLTALAGWYLCATLSEDLGGHGFLGDLRLEFSANRVWFTAGLISGPLFGILGSWWHRTRTLSAGVVAGVLLMGEPLVMASLTLLHAAGVTRQGSGLPLLLRVVPNTWVEGDLAVSVLAAEFAIGLGVVALALRRSTRAASA